jgi:hypothetical protein
MGGLVVKKVCPRVPGTLSTTDLLRRVIWDPEMKIMNVL